MGRSAEGSRRSLQQNLNVLIDSVTVKSLIEINTFYG